MGEYVTSQSASWGHSWVGFESGVVMLARGFHPEGAAAPALSPPAQGELAWSTWSDRELVSGAWQARGTNLAWRRASSAEGVTTAGDWSLGGFLFSARSVVPAGLTQPPGP